MSFIIKLSLGLYVLSVLAFSSWSRALDVVPEANTMNSSFSSFFGSDGTFPGFEYGKQSGFVFEDDYGHLCFQTEDGRISLIHSNSFSLFEGVELPVKVTLLGATSNSGFGDFRGSDIVQINNITFLDL